MAVYQRPLRPDELMHSHKYIDKVRTKGGAWRYIYDLAGGKYKKEAETHRAEANRAHRISRQNYKKADQEFNNVVVNTNSEYAHKNAWKRGKNLTEEQRTMSYIKAKDHGRKADKAAEKAKDYYNKGTDNTIKSRRENTKADRAQEKYKKSLAYKYDNTKQIANSTLKKAKKRIDKGKDFLSNLFKPKITVSHDVRLK